MNFKRSAVRALPALLLIGAFAVDGLAQTHVPTANTKSPGVVTPNILSPELTEVVLAQGAMRLEGTSATTGLTGFYGYDNDGTMIPTGTPAAEATKTEPDKNTYLILKGLTGADPNYKYGTHFLYQGHESGPSTRVPRNNGDLTHPESSYITRINLDADGAHRVTLLATKDTNGTDLPDFDGSMWYPFSQRLLFTAETGQDPASPVAANLLGGVWMATPNYPSTVVDLRGILGAGGYEGVQSDDNGTLYIVEDVGGAKGTGTFTNGRIPNSFVYRFVPYQTGNLLLGGKLQVLQVLKAGVPIEFQAGTTDADLKSANIVALHTYGNYLDTKWITIHDTHANGAAFDANTLAKAAHGTPFKRPENGQFRPHTGFSEFFFTETGDTNQVNVPGAPYGSYGGLFRLKYANLDSGKLSLFYLGDPAHAGLDNLSFWNKDKLVAVEDAGDTLHTQRNALDSAYQFDLNTDYSNPAIQPVRILAQGRDASATTDSLFGLPYNDGDNEITGWHTSDGDATIHGLIGSKVPTPFKDGWRVFYTQQHGDNITYEILVSDPDDFDGHEFKSRDEHNEQREREDE